MYSKTYGRFFIFLYSCLLSSFLTYSCSSSPSVSPPYKSWVLSLDLEKSTLGVPYYSLSVQDLKGLNSLSSLDGGYFIIKEKASIDLEKVKGSIAVGKTLGTGSDPYIRYKVKDSVIVPRDYNSLILLSVYHQYTYLFDKLKEYTGIEPDDLVKKAKNNKMLIFYEPILISKTNNDVSASWAEKINAAYIGGRKQFILNQRSDLERTPLAVGLSVLAHEFGHSLFEYVFYGDLEDESSKKYDTSDAISGINEGFSDYVSYIYTGVSNILGAHFLFESIYVQRDFVASTFTYDNMRLQTKTDPNVKNYKSYCTSSFYCYGTLLARSFYEASNISGYGGEKKYEYFKKIIEALYKTRATLDANIPSEIYDKEKETFIDGVDGSTKKMLALFTYSFLKNFDPSLRSNLCDSFIKNFGLVMDKGIHSEVCPDSKFHLYKSLSNMYKNINLEDKDSFVY